MDDCVRIVDLHIEYARNAKVEAVVFDDILDCGNKITFRVGVFSYVAEFSECSTQWSCCVYAGKILIGKCYIRKRQFEELRNYPVGLLRRIATKNNDHFGVIFSYFSKLGDSLLPFTDFYTDIIVVVENRDKIEMAELVVKQYSIGDSCGDELYLHVKLFDEYAFYGSYSKSRNLYVSDGILGHSSLWCAFSAVMAAEYSFNELRDELVEFIKEHDRIPFKTEYLGRELELYSPYLTDDERECLNNIKVSHVQEYELKCYQSLVSFIHANKRFPIEGEAEFSFLKPVAKAYRYGTVSQEQEQELDILFEQYEKRQSEGERLVKISLIKKSIDAISQYRFSDCRNVYALPFDFYFLYNGCTCVIEYDGLQHYKPISFFGGEKAYARRLNNDRIKTDYCLENGIHLLRIPYTAIKEEDIDLLITNFLDELNDSSLDKAEDEYDLAVAEEAYREYVASGRKSTPIDDFWREIGL